MAGRTTKSKGKPESGTTNNSQVTSSTATDSTTTDSKGNNNGDNANNPNNADRKNHAGSKAVKHRISRLARTTAETDIQVELDLDGSGKAKIDTGIGFFDHMLTSFAKHGLFDLSLTCKGDLHVDCHHTIEDVGIVLGVAIREAVGNKKGIKRYGSALLPMDDALCLCSLDLSGRPYLSFDANFSNERVGYMDTCMVREFFYAISYSAGMNLHLKMLDGINDHHIIEGMFKAFSKALDNATVYDERITDVLSTKGTL